jgi:hypothetical protein
MNKFEEALEKARGAGHELEDDPPVFSSMSRQTCKLCGHAVLGNSRNAYGSATEGPCLKGTKAS